MYLTTIKAGPLCALMLVVLFAASANSRHYTNDKEATVKDGPAIEDDYINLVVKEDQSKVDVYFGGELFTSYLYSGSYKKPVLYPLNTVNGTPVTRGYPLAPRVGEQEDHPHQFGLWLNYGDVNGLDFWNNSDARPAENRSQYGTIYHKAIDHIHSGDDQGELSVTMEWQGPDGEVLLEENTTFIFRETEHTRSVDRKTTLHAVNQEVSLKDNKEGMIGIRMARELEHPDQNGDATGMYKSSEGLSGNDVWGTRAKWMNLSGRINDENVSVAILDHPDNVGYPTYWHARGYGLFAANPLGMKEMSGGKEELNYGLQTGESITFNYRIIIYSGEKVLDEQLEEDWIEFVR
ncbi:MAG: PmoA family protein [Balneolales bacterium]